MFSEECCHMLNIQFEPFLVLVINVYLSQMTVVIDFYPFLYTVLCMVMTNPGQCHSVTIGNHCLLGSQNVRELKLTPFCQTIEKATKMPK